MQRRTALVGTAVVAALLVTAGVGGALSTGAAPAQRTDAQMSDTITVSGSGTVQAEADRAVVRVAVVSSGNDVGDVRADLSDNAQSMREALAETGIDEGQIRTAYYDISSQDRRRGPGGDEADYRGLHAFEITVEDPDSVGEVIDTAVEGGANEVDGVEFTLSQDRREQLRQDALEDAMDDARGEASTVAGAEDLSIEGVDRVSTTDFSRSPYEARGLATGDAGGTSINSGPVTVQASVTVVYDTSG